jgi:hypothetical protein
MRRWLVVAALGAALIAVPSWGQRGGGGHGGGVGGHAGFASHGGGFHGGGMSASRGFSSGFHGGGHFGSGFNRPYHHYYGRYGYGGYYGYPYYSYPYYPYYSYDDYQSNEPYDYSGGDYAGDNYGPSYPANSPPNYANDRQQAEINQLEDEVDRLRQERSQRTSAQGRNDLSSLTELVFRDKHTEEVQNYAIVGQTFWVFDNAKATRIPLAQLDIDATMKANSARGIEFELPR